MMLRQNLAAGEVIQAFKEAYIEAAEDQITRDDEKATNARVSVLTGLDRNEVSRIRRGVDRSGQPLSDEKPILHLNRAARVVTNWPKRDGQALELPYIGNNSFTELVKLHSGGIPANSLLEELERNKTAITLSNGNIKLLSDTYIPSSISSKLEISSEQISRLLHSIDYNTTPANLEQPVLQLELLFNNLSDEITETFRALSKDEMTALLQKLASEIHAKRKRIEASNSIKNSPKPHRKTGLGVYFFDINEND